MSKVKFLAFGSPKAEKTRGAIIAKDSKKHLQYVIANDCKEAIVNDCKKNDSK